MQSVTLILLESLVLLYYNTSHYGYQRRTFCFQRTNTSPRYYLHESK